MKRKIISVCVTCMTVLAMTACGNASQAATSTQTSTSAQVVKSEPQKVTTPAVATKAPETTKAEEKTTVAPTEATTKAPEVTTVAPTEAAGIDYTGFLDSGTQEINLSEVEKVKNFVEEFGVKNFERGERIDLNTIASFNLLSEDIKDFIMIAIADQVADFTSDTLQYKIVNYDRTIQMGFIFESKANNLVLMVKG